MEDGVRIRGRSTAGGIRSGFEAGIDVKGNPGLPYQSGTALTIRQRCSRVSLALNPGYSNFPNRNSDQIALDGGAIHGSCFIRGPPMNAVGKAIWFIESHFSANISLDDIAT